jgi:hypothetical protein
MANTSKAVGFKPAFSEAYHAPHKWTLAASQTIAIGDVVYLSSAGTVTIATATTAGVFLGVAASSCTNSTVYDPIWVWDNPWQVFEGQSVAGLLTDPYITRSADLCFDLVATTGAMYINSAASSYNVFKIVGIGREPNGEESAVGAYMKQLCMFNPALHVFGTTA